jgi:hypothetical protein
MHILSDSQLLAVWERGHRSSAIARTALLAAQSKKAGDRDAMELPVGERDRAVLELRSKLFGTRLRGTVCCPQCNDLLEFDFDCTALAQALPPIHWTEFTAGDVRFRLPNSVDLMAIAQSGSEEEAARMLLDRCCIEDDKPLDYSDALMTEVEQQISLCDPASDLRFQFACSSCSHAWDERLDIGAWCWEEIEIRAHQLLGEVHRLASAYGWSEAEILSLSAGRRRAYLEMCEP